MGKKTPKAPAVPDPIKTAEAQGQANVDTARVNFANSAVNQYTPYGSVEYTNFAPDRWSATQTLSPEQQQIYNIETAGNIQLGNMGLGQMGRVNQALATPFNANQFQQAGTVNIDAPYNYAMTGYGKAPTDKGQASGQNWGVAPDQHNTQYYADLLMQRQQPQMNQQREGIRTNLINSGVREGSEAWNRSMDDYNRQYNDASIAAQLAAGQEQSRQYGLDLQTGQFNTSNKLAAGSEDARMFGQDLSAAQYADQQRAQQYGEHTSNLTWNQNLQNQLTQERQRQIEEAAYFRGVPLNEASALLSGAQVQGPNFVNTPQYQQAPTPYMDAAYQSSNAANALYGAQSSAATANRSANISGMTSLLGTTAMAAMMFSDVRLKDNLERVGTLRSGLSIWRFRFKWQPMNERTIGVIAQEALGIHPAIVHRIGDFLAVDYRRLVELETS